MALLYNIPYTDNMKIFLSFLLSLPFFVAAQTTPLTYTIIQTTATDLNRPGGGAEQWTAGQNVVNIPTQGVNTQRLDAFYRFIWYQLQPQSASGPGLNMNFTLFDAQVQDAINKGQHFSFGIMINYFEQISDVPTTGGGGYSFPLALLNAMQSESTKPILDGNQWYENTNSVSLRTWFKALNVAISNHIATTTFKGVPYSTVVQRVDARIMGDFGENIVLPDKSLLTPANGIPTSAAIDSLLDIYRQAYSNLPNIYVVNMIGIFSGGFPGPSGVGVTPVDAGAFALQLQKNGIPYGWRRDNWGQTDNYIRGLTDQNTNTFGGYHFDTAIMNRFKFAPICGEPQDGGSFNNFSDLVTEIVRYGGQSFGNGNYNNGVNATIQNNIRAGSKAAGYRLILNAGGSVTGSQAGGPFQIVQHWRNVGAAPTYENWNCVYDLRLTPTSTPIWSLTSSFNPRLYSPAGADNVVTDNGTLTSVPAGTYELHMTMKDPAGYRFPMPIYITNTQQADGSYIILTNIVIGTTGAIANAGPNQNITVSSATLSGSASTGATSFLWSQISGPNTATITTPTTVGTTVTGLINGTYNFQLAINGGSSGQLIDQVQVVVAIPPIVANAGANQALVSPTSSTTVNGNLSTGPITTYLWTNISGPNTPTLATPNAVSTTVTGLIVGTYTLQLSVNGGASTDQMNITVSASPVAAAGPDQTIQLPTNSVTVNGSGSTGAVSYAWTRISGPNTPAITSPTAVSTTITGLIAGTYVFQLSINAGASTDQLTVTVNPAVVQANAGNNQTITLPTSSALLSGAASIGATSFSWTNVSGPNTPTLVTPTGTTTAVTGMIAGTYVFQLSINSGASTATTQIKVLPAALPVANAGISQTITLPTSSVTVSGSGSTGNITSYLWSSLSGPNAPVFGTPTTVGTTITGLIQGTYLIQLSLNGGAAVDTMRVYVNPAAPPIPTGQTIFTTQVPANITLKDVEGGGLVGIELGTKFRVSVNGFLLGIRFYKTTGNSGAHTAQLYSSTGTLLASAAFVNESPTGWQYAIFTSPIAITANTTYIASYFSPSGFYTSTTGYFNTAVVNAQMTALADGTDGANGVYKYTNTASFPTSSFNKSNYWVDALFSSPNTNPCNCIVGYRFHQKQFISVSPPPSDDFNDDFNTDF